MVLVELVQQVQRSDHRLKCPLVIVSHGLVYDVLKFTLGLGVRGGLDNKLQLLKSLGDRLLPPSSKLLRSIWN